MPGQNLSNLSDEDLLSIAKSKGISVPDSSAPDFDSMSDEDLVKLAEKRGVTIQGMTKAGPPEAKSEMGPANDPPITGFKPGGSGNGKWDDFLHHGDNAQDMDSGGYPALEIAAEPSTVESIAGLAPSAAKLGSGLLKAAKPYALKAARGLIGPAIGGGAAYGLLKGH